MCGISDHKWRSIIKMFYEEFYHSSDNLDILIKHCYQDSVSLQDFRCMDIPPIAKVSEKHVLVLKIINIGFNRC